MKGHLLMSRKERARKSLFERVAQGHLTLLEASGLLDLSYRQTRRSYKRFCAQGDAGLVHRSRGRPSNRGKGKRFKRKVLARYGQRYTGFGPTLASEKLAAEGLAVDHETLRRWLLEDGQWQRRRKRRAHRKRRERKHHFGELLQMDGSHHRWFGPDKEQCCLMTLIDDATGFRLSLMAEEETTEAAMRTLWRWIARFGIPKAIYADRKNVYITDREPTLDEQLAGQEPLTNFGKVCAKLGIVIIATRSPQAKGRVERSHGVYQDRLVKELALRGITTVATADTVLANGFDDKLNAKFAQVPFAPADFHRPVDKAINLADVFCYEDTRVVQNDWTVRHHNHYYQITRANRPLPKPKDKIVVRQRLDGSIQLLYRGRALQYHRLTPRQLDTQQRRHFKPPRKTKPATKANRCPARTPWRPSHLRLLADTKQRK